MGGSRLVFCQNCGGELQDGKQFCVGCGAPRPAAVSVSESEPQARSRPRSAVIVAVLLVGLVVGFVVGVAANSAVQTTSTRQVTMQVTTTQTTTSFGQQAITGDLVEYCFASPRPPHGDCAGRLIYWFNKATTSIHIMIYSFTLDSVGDALVQAKQRGVDVKIAWDKTEVNVQGSEYQKLKNAGIDIRIDRETGIALLHDKVAIIDGHIIITGSFNWSTEANLHDRENLVVIDSTSWATAYEQNFQEVWNASS
jgi:phosphatidylserine/phosphatidylglycerophosphate/cardiolipin synthase-like enzyme